ncbi:MAG: prepilin-type N-terminal cleavage/methylation domain-containing protein [Pirellulaceae bacterium]|nr:prepilin-type N-terminal cleavage/methylation domain-containing protein [Pirellulaceae bacterium]
MNDSRRRWTDSSRRRAVTLIEVLLVLVILVLVAATAWPSLGRSMADQRLRDAADTVRAEWSRARAKAMSSGVAQRFCYITDDSIFWIEPCEDVSSNGGAAAAVPGATASTEHDNRQLPDPVIFLEGLVYEEAANPLSMAAGWDAELGQPGSPDEGQRGAPVVFQPDGTCTASRLVLSNENDRAITVSINALTAIAVVSEVRDAEEIGP